ncbi:MAG: ABC transporter substrate-binding protein [Planctomycetaceae bacterium]|jgi:branched-chain amino acid transport system substrate-binding protein|nr:ABC transporter substrate-binding protein [Planctomycetaceae bacterium]
MSSGLAAWAAAVGLTAAWTWVAAAPEPITQIAGGSAIRLGQSAPLTGPTAPLGVGVRVGVQAAVAEINRTGGVRGRPVELISLDDGYEPKRTGANMRTLLDTEGVLAVIGSVGAPCAVTAVPIAQEKQTLLYGYVTGGAVLRKSPPDRYVVNYRASLAEEVGLLVDHFVSQGIATNEIAFFTQQDVFGEAAYTGGVAALSRHGLKSPGAVRHVRYERNTSNIEGGLSELLLMDPQPRAVVFGGAADPLIAFVRESRKADFLPIVGTVSFVDATRVAEQLGPMGEGLVISQVVPPLCSGVPVVDRYREALKSVDPQARPGYGSLEGYISARALLESLRTIEGEITREATVEAIRSVAGMDLGLGDGRRLRMRPDGHTIGGYLWLTQIRSSEVVMVQSHRTAGVGDQPEVTAGK